MCTQCHPLFPEKKGPFFKVFFVEDDSGYFFSLNSRPSLSWGFERGIGGGRVFGPLNSHFRKAFRKSNGGTRGTLGVGGSNVASLEFFSMVVL